MCICSHGIPALRHDWFWPLERYAFLNALVSSTSGWNTAGIGTPSPYPAGYMIGPLVGAAGVVIGPFVTLAVFTFAVAITITFGARALARTVGESNLQTMTIQIFAVFNPWVYNESVAGHVYMLLAYGACFGVLAELLRPIVRQRRLIFWLILVLPQLQFFVIAVVAIAIHGIFRRIYLPWTTAVVIGSPLWIGLAFDRSNLLSTPYTLAWETSQSVDPGSAIILSGYFANYAAHFDALQISCIWIVVAFACLGAILARRRILANAAVIAIAALLIAAMGTRGPLGHSYASAVMHFPESGLFRELYDLLGLVAIGYCLLLALLPSGLILRRMSLFALVASLVVASSWATWPPSSFWINRSCLPRVTISTSWNTRFALYPAYQPMQFNGKGSGADPDAYARPGNVTPVNEYLAQYPVNVALSEFARFGNGGPLAGLSTSLVVLRPWLNTDVKALGPQLNGVPPTRPSNMQGLHYLRPLPEVTLDEYPSAGSLTNVIGAGNIFFSDAREVRGALAPPEWRSFPIFTPIHSSNAFVDERSGWTDVGFDFASNPDLGQGLGGVVTTNPRALLPVRGGLTTLVDVRGFLRSQDNRIVSGSTGGYRWLRLQRRTTALRCIGRCVIVGQTLLQHIPVPNPAPRRYVGTTFSVLTPWLVSVDIPANALPVMRYNVAYDSNWVAIARGHFFEHMRLDTTVNGWVLPRSEKSYVLFLLHRVALVQTLAEMLAILWILVVFVYVRRASGVLATSSAD